MENDEIDRPGPAMVLVLGVLAATIILAGTFGYVAAWAIDRWIL